MSTTNLFKPGALVFDIGANVGQSMDQFMQAGSGCVVSVEPCLENYLELLKVKSRYPNCKTVHAACWDRPGFVAARLYNSQTGMSSVMPDRWSRLNHDGAWGDPEHVPCVTIDQLCEYFGKPDFIKVDVEEAELRVLHGMNFKPDLLIYEYTKRYIHDIDECMRHLSLMGFTRGCHNPMDIILERDLNMTLEDCAASLKQDTPDWGNIYVA